MTTASADLGNLFRSSLIAQCSVYQDTFIQTNSHIQSIGDSARVKHPQNSVVLEELFRDSTQREAFI